VAAGVAPAAWFGCGVLAGLAPGPAPNAGIDPPGPLPMGLLVVKPEGGEPDISAAAGPTPPATAPLMGELPRVPSSRKEEGVETC